MTQDTDGQDENAMPDDDVSDDVSDTGNQALGDENIPTSKRPRLEPTAEDIDEGEDEEVATALKAKSEVQPELRLCSDAGSDKGSEEGTSLPDAYKETQSKSSTESHTSGRSTEKITGRTKRH